MVWKNFPLSFHVNAGPAAQAALAAAAQGKFWEMHDKLFANSDALERPRLEAYAKELKLDLPRFRADLDAGVHKARIDADTAQGQALGLTGTPTVFINGHKIAGAYPWEMFKKVADAELAKAKAAH
jgi:protein-disulfide isomerase